MVARSNGVIMLVLAALLCEQATAQTQRGRPQGPRSYTPEFVAVTEQIAKRFDARIVVDPGLFVAAPPSDPVQAKSVDEAVTALTGGLKNAAWRKVYLTRSEAASGLPAAKLAAMVRALDALETGGLVLENPGTRRAVSFQKNLPILPGFAEELRSLNFEPVPVYVIYSTLGEGTGGSVQDRFLDLQRQQLELIMQMDPDTLSDAMAQSMQMFMSLDPQTRSQFVGNMMRAGMQMFMNLDPRIRNEMVGGLVRSGMEMWSNMPPEQRQRFMQEMMQMGQQLFGQAGGQAGARP